MQIKKIINCNIFNILKVFSFFNYNKYCYKNSETKQNNTDSKFNTTIATAEYTKPLNIFCEKYLKDKNSEFLIVFY